MTIYKDVLETIHMIEKENLDIRTTTMGISLLDCFGRDHKAASARVYDKITRLAKILSKRRMRWAKTTVSKS